MAHEITPRAANFIPEAIAASPIKTAQPTAQADIGFEFFNGLSQDVTVVNRAGVQIVVPPLSGSKLNAFVIRSRYNIGHNVIVNTHGLLNDQGRSSSPEAEVLQKNLFLNEDNRVVRGVRQVSCQDYAITLDQFKQNGGILYLQNLDLTLSALNSLYAPTHPYSLKGSRELLEGSDAVLQEQSGLSYRIRIVDRHGRFGSRYVNLAGEVFLIHPVMDSEIRDGVYFTTPMPSTGQSGLSLPRSEYYTFEEAIGLKMFYNSYNEAKTLGNPGDVYKRELEDRAHALKIAEHDHKTERLNFEQRNEREKREFEQDRERERQRQQAREDSLNAQETELRRMEADYKFREQQLKRDQLILKDIFDERSTSRKEYLEILKNIPTLLSGVVALYLAAKKLKGT